MKILHLIGSLSPRLGGPSKACLEMAMAIAERGHDVEIFTTNFDGIRDLEVPLIKPIKTKGISISYFPVSLFRNWVFSLELAKALKNRLKEFDLLHIHSLYLFHNFIGGYFARKYSIPHIIRPHGTLDPYLHKRHRFRKAIVEALFENRNLSNASAIHFTSREEQQLAAPHIFGTKSFIVPNGLNPADYSCMPTAGTLKRFFPQTENKKNILFFGRLNFKKGLDLIIPAFIKLAKESPSYHLILAGPDDEGFGNMAVKQLKKNNLQTVGNHSRLTLTGMVEGEKKLALLNESDIFVLPSYTENFGISVIEAMSCGLPVIISDKVNIWREIVKDGAGIAGPCDSNWLSDAIFYLLNNPKLRHEMSQKGKVSVQSRFEWKKIAETLEKEYEAIIKASS